MSLAKSLPKPKSAIISKWISDDESDSEQPVAKPVKLSMAPEYPNRKNWIPEKQADFNTGGAYPEIHVLQYPLEMGRKGDSGMEQALALQTDENGKIKYDLVLHKNGKVRNGKIVHASVDAMREKDMDIVQAMPTKEELQKVAEETKEALDILVNGNTAAYKPRELGLERAKPTFVKYNPTEKGNTASTRIVRVSEVPVDPLEPPRFKHRKIPRSTGSPPPPVLRSPPRKVSAEEQKNWIIPPCISNWKNAKGYTIPLDKRLANDGRGLQDVTINDNFAKLSEALFIADKHAREEVQLRGEMQTKLAQRLKKEKEEKLRELAQKAREERSRPLLNGTFALTLEESGDEESSSDEEDEKLTAEEKQALRQRQELRREKAKERERSLKQQQSRARPEVKRDISEKIALGQAQPTASRESMYDQRLFNQTSGMSSGFTSSDAYNLYDKPLFNATAVNIYKPTLGGAEENSVAGVDTSEFKSMLANREVHKGFAGTDSDAARSGPVLFEKEADVFGVDAFMKKAKRGRDTEEKSSRKK